MPTLLAISQFPIAITWSTQPCMGQSVLSVTDLRLHGKTYLCHLIDASHMSSQRKIIASPVCFAWSLLPVNFHIPE